MRTRAVAIPVPMTTGGAAAPPRTAAAATKTTRTCFLVAVAFLLAQALPCATALSRRAVEYYQPRALHCDFETTCSWRWNKTVPGFRIVTGREMAGEPSLGPVVDASNRSDGHYLLLSGQRESREWMVLSPKYVATSESCRLSVSMHMALMHLGNFKLVVTANNTSWVVSEIMGNDRRRWDTYNIPLSRISKEFTLMLEIVTSGLVPSHVAVDNITLRDCFPEPPKIGCHEHMFRCDNETCIERDKVCDIKRDCPLGEDEEESLCVPEYPGAFTRCSFESGWCGWNNTVNKPFNWVLHNGSSTSNFTGPQADHTFENATGTYLYINMSQTSKFAEEAVAQSALYYPPPPCHSNKSSLFHNSCKIRFYHHHFGKHSAALKLYLVEMDKKQVHRELWRNYGVRQNKWYYEVVVIPNVTERYFFRFEAKRGLGALGDIALDDISLSPECFGNGLPEDEINGYRYGYTYWQNRRNQFTHPHPDFANKSFYSLSTCGVKGNTGPKPSNCRDLYNETKTHVEILENDPFPGVQRWTAPEGGYYTILAKGASGGLGSETNISSLGAKARLVVELHKGEPLYVLVGQEGSNACWKGISCPSNYLENKPPKTSFSKIVANFSRLNGGGGGGGGSFVYKLSEDWKGAWPVIVAGGGGGLCSGSTDDGRQHGHGVNKNRSPIPGTEFGLDPDAAGGAGGGWRRERSGEGHNADRRRDVTGLPLLLGGQGGKPCSRNGEGVGGFGGGGSGCQTGGGGGGYSGGHTWSNGSSAGEGGYSYLGSGLLGEVIEGAHDGPGEVFIIPAVPGCHCDYLCVALDEHRHTVQCICPDNWELADNNISCVNVVPEPGPVSAIIISVLVLLSILLVVGGVGTFCFFLWMKKCVEKKKEAGEGGKVLFAHPTLKDQDDCRGREWEKTNGENGELIN